MSDEDFVVKRWRQYGKDRLYVETSDGAKIGFWDLVTDTAHPESPDGEPTLVAAVTHWTSSVAPEDSGIAADAPAAEVASAEEVVPVEEAVPVVDQLAVPAPTPVGDEPDPDPVPDGEAARPWVDLATNRPGAEARERAQAARDAAPVKTVFARVLGVHTDERAWRIGADGQERVASQFAKVARKDPRWRFLHAVPVGSRGSDIDHVVVGPGGVFTVNAKHHPRAKVWVGGNTFLVNGIKQPYVRNARHEAQRAARLLSEACGFPVAVHGLIVTVNAGDVVVKSQPEGVTVTPRMHVARWLLRHGEILTAENVDAIYEVARRSTTWR